MTSRLWAKIKVGEPDECWPWTGWCNPAGYGVISLYLPGDGDGIKYYVHRLAHADWNGLPILRRGGVGQIELVICHSCDNPPCCNPAHLINGTPAVNNADKKQKWRHEHGSRHHNAKLDEAKVAEILRLMAAGLSNREIAPGYEVNPSVISEIRGGKAWPHVPRP